MKQFKRYLSKLKISKNDFDASGKETDTNAQEDEAPILQKFFQFKKEIGEINLEKQLKDSEEYHNQKILIIYMLISIGVYKKLLNK